MDKKLRQATICLLRKNDEVLLAMKKRGFGVGKWNGVGGKVKAEFIFSGEGKLKEHKFKELV